MILNFLGTELNSSIEHELFPTNKQLGFKVTIKFKLKEVWEGDINILNNATEVHHLYKPLIKTDRRIAIESDIHKTGCTFDIDDIETVTIELADKIEQNF